MTGVEAVSNSVPNFKERSIKRAQTVLILLSLVVLFLFGGTALLANMYRVYPDPSGTKTVLSQIAEEIFGRHTPMCFFIQATNSFNPGLGGVV